MNDNTTLMTTLPALVKTVQMWGNTALSKPSRLSNEKVEVSMPFKKP